MAFGEIPGYLLVMFLVYFKNSPVNTNGNLESHFELKSCEISLAHAIHFSGLIGLTFFTKHSSNTAVFYENIHNVWIADN